LERALSAGKAGYRQLFHHFPKTIFQFVPQKIYSFHHKTLPHSHFPTKSQNENRSHGGNDKFLRLCCNPSMNDNLPSTGQARPGKNPPLRIECAGQKSWSAGLQPAFGGIFGDKPSATRRSDFSTLAFNFFVLHPRVEEGSPAISRPDPYGMFAVPSPWRGRSAATDGGGIGKVVRSSQSSLIKANQDIKRPGGVGKIIRSSQSSLIKVNQVLRQ
jgi:hypothetical protein